MGGQKSHFKHSLAIYKPHNKYCLHQDQELKGLGLTKFIRLVSSLR